MKCNLNFARTLLMLACSTAIGAGATDLDLDAGFGSGGTFMADFTGAQGSYDVGMRAFKECDKAANGLCRFPLSYHYFVAGFHNHASTQDAIVALISEAGVPIASFGSGGQLTVPTAMASINDIAFDPVADRLYFVGSQRLLSITSLDFGVFCLDIATRAACGDFGNAGTELVSFDLGGNDTDVATRVLFDPQGFLYVAGYANAANGYQVAVAKLAAANGAPVTTFAGTGRDSYVLGSRATGQSVSVSAMALIPASYQGIQLDKLYLAGAYKTAAGDNDGYVLSLNAIGGSYVNARTVSADSIFTAAKNDTVAAMTVLANGDLALAGSSDSDTPNQPKLLLAKLRADSSLAFVPEFCGSGLCAKPLGTDIHPWTGTLPSAIAERPQNRDLVVGMRAGTWTLNFITSQYELSDKQVVQQYGASGNVLHADREIQFPALDPSTLVVRSFGMNADDASIDLVGSRSVTSFPNDIDVTMTRMLANDSIFASQFGGSHSD